MSRPYDRDASYRYRRTGQNRAERRVYKYVSNQSGYDVNSDWFARVYTTGSAVMQDPIYADQTCPDSWLLMDYHPSLLECYPDLSEREQGGVANRFDSHFSDHIIRPAIIYDNIGIRVSSPKNAPPFREVWEHPGRWWVYIDYGALNWSDEELTHPE